MTIKITKQLATVEDLAIGTGTVIQERNGVPLTLTKIDLITASKLASENAGEGAALVSMEGGPSVEVAVLDRVIRVKSVANLEDLTGVNDYLYQIKGWHPDTGYGGGVFYFDSAAAKSGHNGITVFSPTVPWTTTVSNYLSGVGETDSGGTGVFVRTTENDDPFPNLSWAGARTDAENVADADAAIVQCMAVFNGFKFSGRYHYTTPIRAQFGGTTIEGIVGNLSLLTYEGPDADWAFQSDDLSAGSYTTFLSGFMIQGPVGTNTKKIFNFQAVRFSKFVNMRSGHCLISTRSTSNWNNYFEKFLFYTNSPRDGSVETTGIDFATDAEFSLSNAAQFIDCRITANDVGIKIQGIGDAVSFLGCGIEGNGVGILITGSGGGTAITFQGCYIESNLEANIRWDKTSAGLIYGLSFLNNYFGFSPGLSGVIEFVASNGGAHEITFEGNRFRNFHVPTSLEALVVNGATMSNIVINWYRNRGVVGVGADVIPWDQSTLDWRYMNTDVYYYLTLLDDARNWVSAVPLRVRVENGTARLTGTFQSVDNAFSGALPVAETIALTLRPGSFHQQMCTRIINSGSAGVPVTCMLNGGTLRVIGVTGDKVWVDMSWILSIGAGDKRLPSNFPL